MNKQEDAADRVSCVRSFCTAFIASASCLGIVTLDFHIFSIKNVNSQTGVPAHTWLRFPPQTHNTRGIHAPLDDVVGSNRSGGVVDAATMADILPPKPPPRRVSTAAATLGAGVDLVGASAAAPAVLLSGPVLHREDVSLPASVARAVLTCVHATGKFLVCGYVAGRARLCREKFARSPCAAVCVLHLCSLTRTCARVCVCVCGFGTCFRTTQHGQWECVCARTC